MKKLLIFFLFVLPVFGCGNIYAQKEGLPLIDSLLKQLSRQKEDTNKVLLLDNIADAFGEMYPDESIKYELLELDLSVKLHWKKGIAYACAHLGDDYAAEKNIPLAFQYMHKSLYILENVQDTEGRFYLAHELNNIALQWSTMKNYDSALLYFQQALKQYETIGSKGGTTMMFVQIANNYMSEKNYEEAIAYCLKAGTIAKSENSTAVVAAVNGVLGAAYLGMADNNNNNLQSNGIVLSSKKAFLDSSIKYLELGIAGSEKFQLDNLVEFSKKLVTAYSLCRNYKKAFEVSQNMQLVEDSLNKKSNEDEKIIREKLVKTNESQLKLKTEELANEKKVIILFIFGLGLFACIVLITVRSNKAQKKLNNTITKLVTEQEETIRQRTAQLAESNDRLAHANKKLVELIQYNAHNLREPLARVMGAMIIQEYVTSEEFYADIWPQMQKAVTDLDNSIKEVITIADETVNLYG